MAGRYRVKKIRAEVVKRAECQLCHFNCRLILFTVCETLWLSLTTPDSSSRWVRCWKNVANQGEEVRNDNRFPASREKRAYCCCNNLWCFHLSSINHLPWQRSMRFHWSLLANSKYGLSVLTWLRLTLQRSGFWHSSCISKYPNSSVFPETEWLNIHIKMHKSSISQLHSRAIYLSEADQCRDKSQNNILKQAWTAFSVIRSWRHFSVSKPFHLV